MRVFECVCMCVFECVCMCVLCVGAHACVAQAYMHGLNEMR